MSKLFINSIGTVIPLGDGATGKSILTKHLIDYPETQEDALKIAQTIKKSLNVELEYDTQVLDFEDKTVSTAIQYYVFPGQRQKISKFAPSFDDIVNIFEFLPALKKVTVLLLIFDTTRLESLKSLESWLLVSISRGWISSKTKLILVSNKIDLQASNHQFIENVKDGIYQMIRNKHILIEREQITSIDTSAVSLHGINNLRQEIFEWIAHHGTQRVKDSSYFYNKNRLKES